MSNQTTQTAPKTPKTFTFSCSPKCGETKVSVVIPSLVSDEQVAKLLSAAIRHVAYRSPLGEIDDFDALLDAFENTGSGESGALSAGQIADIIAQMGETGASACLTANLLGKSFKGGVKLDAMLVKLVGKYRVDTSEFALWQAKAKQTSDSASEEVSKLLALVKTSKSRGAKTSGF